MPTCQLTHSSIKSVPLEAAGKHWTDAVEQLQDRLADDVDGVGADEPVTFGPAWARQRQADLFRVDGYARQWVESTVLLSPTASTELPGTDEPVPPLTHLRSILDTRSARQSALSRALPDVDRWRAVRVLGPTRSGYVAPHTGLYLSAGVDRERFDGWLSAHIDNCRLADQPAHVGSVSIEDSPSRNERAGLCAYLMQNGLGLDTTGERSHGLPGKPAHRWRAGAVVRASDYQPVSVGPAGGARVD